MSMPHRRPRCCRRSAAIKRSSTCTSSSFSFRRFMTTIHRLFNFSAGPAVMPLPVLEEIQRDLIALPGVGMSVLEISHRSKTFEDILAAAEADIRALAGIPSNYKVLFLQGGASLQFSMVPMNFLGAGQTADYID